MKSTENEQGKMESNYYFHFTQKPRIIKHIRYVLDYLIVLCYLIQYQQYCKIQFSTPSFTN